MQISSRSGLISAVSDWLLRTDLDERIDTFIQLAEVRLMRDNRVKRHRVDEEFIVDGASVALPDGFKEIDELTYDGSPGLPQLRSGTLATIERQRKDRGSAAHPRVYALEGRSRIHFAPVPSGSHTMTLSYWQGLHPRLDEGTLSNWVLARHPDVYLYSVLIESAPYLREDERLETWNLFRENALEEMRLKNEAEQFSGNLTRFPARAIG